MRSTRRLGRGGDDGPRGGSATWCRPPRPQSAGRHRLGHVAPARPCGCRFATGRHHERHHGQPPPTRGVRLRRLSAKAFPARDSGRDHRAVARSRAVIGGRRPLQGRKPADRRVRVDRPHSPYFRYMGPGHFTAKEAASVPRTPVGRALARVRAVLFGRPLSTPRRARPAPERLHRVCRSSPRTTSPRRPTRPRRSCGCSSWPGRAHWS